MKYNDKIACNDFAYGRPNAGGFRYPIGTGPGKADDCITEEAFSAVGLKKEVKSWVRLNYFGIGDYLKESLSEDITQWPEKMPQKSVPEIFSVQEPQSARLEWRTVGNIPGRQKLTEELIKVGMKEGQDFRFYGTEMSPTCGNIQFMCPFYYKFFLRLAADFAIHDKTNQAGWKLHPFDGLYNYINHDVFIKPFCIEGLRLPRNGPPVQKRNQTTIDCTVNWQMMEQTSEALSQLNDYTLNKLAPHFRENYERFSNKQALKTNLPKFNPGFKVDGHLRWLNEYARKDFTASVYRNQAKSRDEWKSTTTNKRFGQVANRNSREILDLNYDLIKQRLINDKLAKSRVENLLKTIQDMSVEDQVRYLASMTSCQSNPVRDYPEKGLEIPIKVRTCQEHSSAMTTTEVQTRQIGTGDVLTYEGNNSASSTTEALSRQNLQTTSSETQFNQARSSSMKTSKLLTHHSKSPKMAIIKGTTRQGESPATFATKLPNS